MPQATLCPSHGLPLDRRRAWAPTGDAFMWRSVRIGVQRSDQVVRRPRLRIWSSAIVERSRDRRSTRRTRQGKIVVFPQVGGLHNRYERRTA
jgi:hypothetical protein